jgi:hypothetical protein
MWKTHQRTKLRVRFITGLLALLAIVSAAVPARQTLAKQEASAPSGPQAIPASKVPATFALEGIGDGILCPSTNLDCEEHDILWKRFTLVASDGHTLYLKSIPFPSIERSKRQFALTIKSAEKIVRRNVESNSKGEQVGERAVGLFPKIKDSKPPWGVPYYELFWTWGPNYLEITGEHLDDLLALEQKLKEEGVNAVWRWHERIPSSPD